MKFDGKHGRLERPGDRLRAGPLPVRRRRRRGHRARARESVWARLGSDVTVVELLPKIVAGFDDDVVRAFARLLQKQGLKIETGAKVTGLRSGGGAAVLLAERDGRPLEFPAEKVLVAVGRRPYTDGLGLEKAGVALDEKRRVKVDARLRTGVPGIWAIGDVVAGPMLAHKAEEDGVAVAEWIAGRAGHVDWDLVPAIVYTDPEVACVGIGEDAARARSMPVNVGKFNLGANGRAIANDSTDGFAKIVADARTDRILGAQILGRGAGELIAEVVAHMEYGGSAEDLGRTIHAHPTLSEVLKEAGLAVSKVGNPCYLTRAAVRGSLAVLAESSYPSQIDSR